jgi:hypothetical protein
MQGNAPISHPLKEFFDAEVTLVFKLGGSVNVEILAHE